MKTGSERFSDWVLWGPDANVRIHGTLSLPLPSGRVVEVRRRLVKFKPWAGATPKLPEVWTSKCFADVNGEPLLAELAILHLVEREGWTGVWVNNFTKQFLKGLPKLTQPCSLPSEPLAVFQDIEQRNGGRGGCWDVFAWRGDQVLFAEAKRMKKDAIRKSQLKWLEAGLQAGVPLDAFLVVEWDLMSQP